MEIRERGPAREGRGMSVWRAQERQTEYLEVRVEVRKVGVRWRVKAISFVMIFPLPPTPETKGCCKKRGR